MYKMVEDVTVSVQGKEITKKVLYLTNKQVSLFDETAMVRCIQALEIGKPKFVILLAPSVGMELQTHIGHAELINTPPIEYMSCKIFGDTDSITPASLYNGRSEFDTSDSNVVASQVLLFMKTCILPLAIQTKVYLKSFLFHDNQLLMI